MFSLTLSYPQTHVSMTYICGIALDTWQSRCTIAMVLLSVYSSFRQFLGGHTSDTVCPKHIILFADVTSYVTSQHRTCFGHMTFHYKRSANASVGVLACCSSIHQVRLYHQRPACGWCLMRVGHDTFSMSLGWSLLPSTVIIVLALVNSTVSPVGTPKYLNETQECYSTPC